MLEGGVTFVDPFELTLPYPGAIDPSVAFDDDHISEALSPSIMLVGERLSEQVGGGGAATDKLKAHAVEPLAFVTVPE